MKKRIKYQRKLVTVPSATAATSTSEADIQLDKSYDRCTGIAVHTVSDGGIANGYFLLGIKDLDRQFQDLSHIDNWTSGSAVSPDEKFKTIDIPVQSGNLTTIQVNNPAALVSDLQVEVIFRLEKDEVPV